MVSCCFVVTLRKIAKLGAHPPWFLSSR